MLMSSKIYIQYFETPAGELMLGDFEGQLCLMDWSKRKNREAIDKRIQSGLKAEYIEQDSPILQQARLQLTEYFKQQLTTFYLPLCVVGTDFQKQVWQALQDVGYGETLSYQQLSKHIENEKAVRAVANAVGANAMSIIVPCHRVIGTDGSITGYAGGLDAKKLLLSLEET
ncbi:MAG: methylated-DNA--[protein]-cysteine S-methyltransferase [Ghiorsea sp.]